MMDCIALEAGLFCTSVIMIARMIGTGKTSTIFMTLINRVLPRIRMKSEFAANSFSNCEKPLHGVMRIDCMAVSYSVRSISSLNAMISPDMGI